MCILVPLLCTKLFSFVKLLRSVKVFYSRDVKFDITVFPYQNVPVPRPVSFPVDDLVTTSSIVGDADEFADATTSDISIDLDVDATNQQNELYEKHGTDGEDSCSLEELDLLETCSESSFSDEMPDLSIKILIKEVR